MTVRFSNFKNFDADNFVSDHTQVSLAYGFSHFLLINFFRQQPSILIEYLLISQRNHYTNQFIWASFVFERISFLFENKMKYFYMVLIYNKNTNWH